MQSLKGRKESSSRMVNLLSSSLKTTIEKIKSLETEKKNLLTEIEELKKTADARAMALENEVCVLRNEVKSLKSLMNGEPNT